MADIKLKKDLKLTDDPLTNIYMMIPFLDDNARMAISYLMFGCCIGRELKINKSNQNDKSINIA